MKASYIHFLTLLCLFQPLEAQTIEIEESTENGTFITTSELPVYKSEDGGFGSVSLGVAYNKAMKTFFSLNLRVKEKNVNDIKKGCSLQLISNDGEIIILHSSDQAVESDNGQGLIVSFGVQYNEVELADMDKLMNNRIVRLKLETPNGILCRELDDNNFAVSVFKCFQVLKDRLEGQTL